MRVLGRYTGSSIVDTVYPFILPLDAEKMEDEWWKRRAYLARYGRQSMLQWDDVETIEVRRYAKAISDLIGEESTLSRVSEDG